MRKREQEANLFRFFLTLQPLFAGEAIADWRQPAADPPDVLCRTASGQAVVLGSSLDQVQMDFPKQQERIETDTRAAIGEQPNSTQHF